MFTTIITLLQQFLFVSFIKTQAFKRQLSQSEENEYVEKYLNGDHEARNKLIEHNLRLVAHIAKKYEGGKDMQEDLISIGTIGLIKAIDSYQPNKAARLGTYAARCIENEILMHLRANKNHYHTLSLDDMISNNADCSMSLLDSLSIPQEKSQEEEITLNDDKQKLIKMLAVLDEKEKDIIIKRYGLAGNKEYKQKEIAKEMRISRSYVSRIEKRALMKLYREYTKK